MLETSLVDPNLAVFHRYWSNQSDLYQYDGPETARNFLLSYDNRFGDPLQTFGYSSFSELLISMKQTDPDRQISVLDLMGEGLFIDPSEADKIVGLRLNSPKHTSTYPNRHLIIGDIRANNTCNQLQNYMNQENVEGFDLIVCSPIGAFNLYMKQYINPSASPNRQYHDYQVLSEEILAGYQSLMQKYMLQLLSRTNTSYVFSELPTGVTKEMFENSLLEQPQEVDGCTFCINPIMSSFSTMPDYESKATIIKNNFYDRIQFGMRYTTA